MKFLSSIRRWARGSCATQTTAPCPARMVVQIRGVTELFQDKAWAAECKTAASLPRQTKEVTGRGVRMALCHAEHIPSPAKSNLITKAVVGIRRAAAKARSTPLQKPNSISALGVLPSGARHKNSKSFAVLAADEKVRYPISPALLPEIDTKSLHL